MIEQVVHSFIDNQCDDYIVEEVSEEEFMLALKQFGQQTEVSQSSSRSEELAGVTA
ncbi:hypothetical protein [Pleionea sp. CnH1-48]|uniref:hypothetical protein n=1 Tax=Pleionea sp. CnH1-48 TaxID=2954494 RepID=UPI002097E06A|nr:hypothetical protein [Pleionea sp. CnH1-48]MCO7224856.1 hypothetical protein [Pleionea sp. CnH1-48]